MKGLVSFLDIQPQDLRPQLVPVDTPSLDDVPYIEDRQAPADDPYPDATPSSPTFSSPVVVTTPPPIKAPAATLPPVIRRSSGDRSSSVAAPIPDDILSYGRYVNRSGRPEKNMAIGDVPSQNRHIIHCKLAQDGHSLSEESVYKVLWEASVLHAEGIHIVRMGYAELAARARISKRTVIRIVPVLIEKLSIKVLDQHNSRDLTPKLYQVNSYKEILEKRRSAGLEYVVRTKGVTFVTATGVPIFETKAPSVSSADGMKPDDTFVPDDGLSPGDVAEVSEKLNTYYLVDEAAVVHLIRACRAIRQDASAEEISFFAAEKMMLAKTSRSIHNPTGFVLSTVPSCFEGRTFEAFRRRRAEQLRLQQEEEERQKRESADLIIYLRRKAEAVLADPASTEVARQRAEDDLKTLIKRG